jgi:UDP-sugar transporter A1/2/3
MFNNPDGRSTANMLKTILASMITSESIKLFVPALLYLIQNNLLFSALKNLSVPVYQVLNQGKLFTTAFFSRLLLDKEISYCQYFSLLMLAMGVVIVQQSTNKDQSSSMNEGNPWIGFLAVLFSCITSGFAAVYFEKLLKQKTDNTKKVLSVYIRNMSMAFWSIGLGTFPIFMTDDWNLVQQNGLFQGFTWIVLTIIVFQAITGLLVGFVMKYADSVLKGFATSVAVVVATILSIVFFNDSVNLIFLVGATLVIFAVRTYTNTNNPSAGEGASDSSQPFYKKKLAVGVAARIVRVAVTALSCTGCVLYYYPPLLEDTATLAYDSCDVEGGEVPLLVPPMFRNVSVEVSVLSACKLEYMRSKEELLAKQKHINTTTCPSSVEVYASLMDKVNSCGFDGKHALMIAYGELIHLLRDNAVLRPDGGYMDDDFDTWVTVPTVSDPHSP